MGYIGDSDHSMKKRQNSEKARQRGTHPDMNDGKNSFLDSRRIPLLYSNIMIGQSDWTFHLFSRYQIAGILSFFEEFPVCDQETFILYIITTWYFSDWLEVVNSVSEGSRYVDLVLGIAGRVQRLNNRSTTLKLMHWFSLFIQGPISDIYRFSSNLGKF